MNQSLMRCLLSAACIAATSLSSVAQSAPAGRSDAKRSAASPSREQMQIRIAEVMSMLEEDQLTDEQRARALAKLADIRDQLARERATSNAVRGLLVAPRSEERRARFRAAEAPERVMVEVERLEAPLPPVPPTPPTAPTAPTPPDTLEVVEVPTPESSPVVRELFAKRVAEAEADAHVVEVRAKMSQDAAESFAKRAKELEKSRAIKGLAFEKLGKEHRALALRHAEQALELAKVERDHAAAHEDERFDVVVRTKNRKARADADHDASPDSDDLREMVQQMREEMREIRAMIREMRVKSKHLEETRRNAQAPLPAQGGGLHGFRGAGGSGAPAAPSQGGGGAFAPAAPAQSRFVLGSSSGSSNR